MLLQLRQLVLELYHLLSAAAISISTSIVLHHRQQR